VAKKAPNEAGLTARKKADAVIRLLRGESLDELNRELRVEAHRLQAWSEASWPAARGTKAKPLQPDDRRLRDGERKIGELTMDNEILRAAARTRGLQIHPEAAEIAVELEVATERVSIVLDAPRSTTYWRGRAAIRFGTRKSFLGDESQSKGGGRA
jgi:hypothetical protein